MPAASGIVLSYTEPEWENGEARLDACQSWETLHGRTPTGAVALGEIDCHDSAASRELICAISAAVRLMRLKLHSAAFSREVLRCATTSFGLSTARETVRR